MKDTLRRAKTSLLPNFQGLHQRTRCVIFLGTPHRGSGKTGWGQIASNLATYALMDTNKALLDGLVVNSEILDSNNTEFMKIVHTDGLLIHSFQEGRGLSELNGFSGKVVEDYSSKLDYPLEIVESLDANHMQMARFGGPTDPNYQKISGTLANRVSQMQAQMNSQDERLDGSMIEPTGFRLEKVVKYVFDILFSKMLISRDVKLLLQKLKGALHPVSTPSSGSSRPRRGWKDSNRP